MRPSFTTIAEDAGRYGQLRIGSKSQRLGDVANRIPITFLLLSMAQVARAILLAKAIATSVSDARYPPPETPSRDGHAIMTGGYHHA